MIKGLDNMKSESEEAENLSNEEQFLEELEDEETEKEFVKKPKSKGKKKSQNSIKVVAQSVHTVLHSAPDVYARKVTRLNTGNQLVVEDDLGAWLKVSFKKSGEELVGFVRSNKVKRI